MIFKIFYTLVHIYTIVIDKKNITQVVPLHSPVYSIAQLIKIVDDRMLYLCLYQKTVL